MQPNNDGWFEFQDSGGQNNAYDLGGGYQFHCHGQDFAGPASLKYGNETIEHLTPGDALFRAAMDQFAQNLDNNGY